MSVLDTMNKFDNADWGTYKALLRSGKSEDEAISAMSERLMARADNALYKAEIEAIKRTELVDLCDPDDEI